MLCSSAFFYYLCGIIYEKCMKKVLFFIACLLTAGAVSAQKVSVSDAREAARVYLGSKVTRGGATDLRLAHTQYSLDGSNTEDVYIFNNGDDGGFVIVAGDMRASSLIIGHSDSGAFDADDIPTNMAWWLSEYARQIDFMRENVAEVSPTRAKAGVRAGAPKVIVAPLLGSLWSQNTPFNDMAPAAGKGHCPTGCVATAMAQIMYFHKWPKTGTGEHTNKNFEKQHVDFSKSVYQWDKMRDVYNQGAYTPEEGAAVAKLMYDCGASVDMSYGASGSGAFSEDVPKALTNYFDYSSSMKIYFRDKQTDWDDMIMKDLDQKRPVYYSGTDIEAGGHAFVADGYEIDGDKVLFHFNWGWGGSGNCYCLSNALKPEDGQGYNFVTSQAIVIGIKANNKIKVGALYYNAISDTEAQVTFAESNSEYSGDITIPSTVTLDGKTCKVTSVNASAFSGCTQLTSIDIPTSITAIGGSAFAGCTSLKTLKVNWTETVPQISSTAFGEDVLNNAALVVPDGMVGYYSNHLPWMLFATVKDGKGETVEYSEWQPFETGRGLCTYNVMFTGTDSLDVAIRSSKADPDKCVIQCKDYITIGCPLIINYDKKTNKCQVLEQSTDYPITYNVEDSVTHEVLTATDILMVADVLSYTDDPELEKDYPSNYDPVNGRFSLNLVYYVKAGSFGYGEERLQMAGDFKTFGIKIMDVTEIQEKTDGSGSQKFTLEGEKDMAKFRYAVLNGKLSTDSVRIAAMRMADGTIETKTKSAGLANIASATYAEPGEYTFIAISTDAEGTYHGDYTYMGVTFVSNKEWDEIAKGSYTYSLFYTGEDTDRSLYRNRSDHSKWKITNLFRGVELVFNWDESTDIVTFETQPIGEEYGQYGSVYISNNNDFFPETSKYYGEASRFDRKKSTFMFSVVYNVEAGFFSDCIGVETFAVPGLATDIQTQNVISSRQMSGSAYNLNGQMVDDSYKGVMIRDGKKFLRR